MSTETQSMIPVVKARSAQQSRRKRLRPRRVIASTALYATVAVACIVALAPLWYIVRTSFMSNDAYFRGRSDFSFESWVLMFTHTDVLRQLLNSSIVTFSSIILILAIGSAAAYGFSKLLSGGLANTAFLIITIVFMIPTQSIIASMFFQAADAGLTGSLFGVVLIYVASSLPLSIFLLTAFFRAVPREIFEAALMDGASYLSIVVRVLIPMSVPALITVATLQFIFIWNDLLVGLLWLAGAQDLRILTVGLATIQTVGGMDGASVPMMMAGAVLQSIPAVLLFAFFQKYVVRGLTSGAVQ